MAQRSRLPSTLDKYRRVNPTKEDTGPSAKNEIKITQKRLGSSGYVLYAANLLLKENEESVTIKAAGNAAAKGVLVAEILRHRVPGLHSINKLSFTEITDVWEPLEEGLDVVKNTKTLTILEIKLTKKPTSEETKDPNYQAPVPADQVQQIDLDEPRPRGGRRRGGPRDQEGDEEGKNEGDDREERPRRGGRGGRGGRGRRGGGRRGGGPRDYDDDEREPYKQKVPFTDDREDRDYRKGQRGEGQRGEGQGQRGEGQRGEGQRGEGQRGGGRPRGGNRGGGNRGYDDRDDDYNRGGSRGGYRGGNRDYDDRDDDYNRGGRGGSRGGGRGGSRGGGNRGYDDRDDDYNRGGSRGGNRGGSRGGNRDYDDRDDYDRDNRGGSRGGTGSFRRGGALRGRYRGAPRGGN